MKEKSPFSSRAIKLEQLENRELMASDITANLLDGVLRVTGSDNADQIVIRRIDDTIQVSGVVISDPSGDLSVVNYTAVDAILIDALAGNDLIWIDDHLKLSVDARGGAGFDLFRAGQETSLTTDASFEDTLSSVIVADIWQQVQQVTPDIKGQFALSSLSLGGFKLTAATVGFDNAGVNVSGTLNVEAFGSAATFSGTIKEDSDAFELTGILPATSLLGKLIQIKESTLKLNQHGITVNAQATIAKIGDVVLEGQIFPDGSYFIKSNVSLMVAGISVPGGELTLGSDSLKAKFSMPVPGIGNVPFEGSYGPTGWSLKGTYPGVVTVGPVVIKSIAVAVSSNQATGESITVSAKATIAGIDGVVDADAKATIFSDGRFDMTIDANAVKVGGFTLGNAKVTLDNLNAKRTFVTRFTGEIGVAGLPKIYLTSVVDAKGNYSLEAKQDFQFGGLNFSNVKFALGKTTGLTLDADLKFQFLTIDVNGSVSSAGHFQLHGTSKPVVLANKFQLDAIAVDIDMNRQAKSYTMHVQGTSNILIGTVNFSADVKGSGTAWPTLVMSGTAKVGGALASLFTGKATFTISSTHVSFEGELGLKNVPKVVLDITGTVTKDGVLSIKGYKVRLSELIANDWQAIGNTLLAANASLSDVAIALAAIKTDIGNIATILWAKSGKNVGRLANAIWGNAIEAKSSNLDNLAKALAGAGGELEDIAIAMWAKAGKSVGTLANALWGNAIDAKSSNLDNLARALAGAGGELEDIAIAMWAKASKSVSTLASALWGNAIDAKSSNLDNLAKALAGTGGNITEIAIAVRNRAGGDITKLANALWGNAIAAKSSNLSLLAKTLVGVGFHLSDTAKVVWAKASGNFSALADAIWSAKPDMVPFAHAIYGTTNDLFAVANALGEHTSDYFRIARILAYNLGGNVGTVAQALYRSNGLDLDFYQVARALFNAEGLDLNRYQVARLLYNGDGLDLSMTDVVKALYNGQGLDLSLEEVARVIYKGEGLDASFNRTVSVLCDALDKTWSTAYKAVKSIL